LYRKCLLNLQEKYFWIIEDVLIKVYLNNPPQDYLSDRFIGLGHNVNSEILSLIYYTINSWSFKGIYG